MQGSYAQHMQLWQMLNASPISEEPIREYLLWIENGFRLGSEEDSTLWEAQEPGFLRALRMVLGDTQVDAVLMITDKQVAQYLL
jgi:hypothetical protein